MVAVALTFTLTANAQEENADRQGQRPSEEQMMEQRTKRMVEKYKLSDEQATKLTALNKEYAGKLGGPMGGPRGPRGGAPQAQQDGQQQNVDGQTGATQQQRPELTDEQKAEMQKRMQEQKTNQEAYDKALKEILTDEQYTSYENDRKQMQQRRGGPRGQRRERPQQESEN